MDEGSGDTNRTPGTSRSTLGAKCWSSVKGILNSLRMPACFLKNEWVPFTGTREKDMLERTLFTFKGGYEYISLTHEREWCSFNFWSSNNWKNVSEWYNSSQWLSSRKVICLEKLLSKSRGDKCRAVRVTRAECHLQAKTSTHVSWSLNTYLIKQHTWWPSAKIMRFPPIFPNNKRDDRNALSWPSPTVKCKDCALWSIIFI